MYAHRSQPKPDVAPAKYYLVRRNRQGILSAIPSVAPAETLDELQENLKAAFVRPSPLTDLLMVQVVGRVTAAVHVEIEYMGEATKAKHGVK